MESLAVASPALYQDVLQDPCYHHRVHRFLSQLEKQVLYLERRSFVSRDVVEAVTLKYNSLRSYYEGFTKHSGNMVPPKGSRLKLFFLPREKKSRCVFFSFSTIRISKKKKINYMSGIVFVSLSRSFHVCDRGPKWNHNSKY
jgi:hypothetical protein